MPSKTVTTTGVHQLTNVSEDRIGTLEVHVTGTFTGSLTFQGRDFPNASLTSSDDVSLYYTTPASSTLANTAITAPGVFWIRADGLVVDANVSALSSGSIVFNYKPLYG